MFAEIEKAWSHDAMGYDDLIKKQLKNKRDVAYWQQELETVLGKEKLKVLDVGCGPGFFSIMLFRLGHNVTAVDGAEGMVACAKKNFEAEQADITTYVEDAVKLEEENESYDIIISRDVVWTLYDPFEAFARWKQILKPNGKVIIYDGNYRKNQDTVKIAAWKILSNILVFLTEGRIQHETKHEVAFDNLPMVLSNRPEKDRELLIKNGFKNIRVTDDNFRNSATRMEYWKYGYQGKKFRVIACKDLVSK